VEASTRLALTREIFRGEGERKWVGKKVKGGRRATPEESWDSERGGFTDENGDTYVWDKSDHRGGHWDVNPKRGGGHTNVSPDGRVL
jgi:hypothetical protein